MSGEAEALNANAGRAGTLSPGEVRAALAFLADDPCSNVWLTYNLLRYGVFNLGLPEQGDFYVFRGSQSGMEGLLYCGNLGYWRFTARSPEALAPLLRRALDEGRTPQSITGEPEALEGAVEMLVEEGTRCSGLPRVLEKEAELVMCLEEEAPQPGLEAGARFAVPADVEEMVRLEKGLQVHLLGCSADDDFLRERVRDVVEKGRAAVFPVGRRLAAKAELEIEVTGVSQLSGVFTRTRFRRRGCAAAACSLIVRRALEEGRTVCLETQEDNIAALSLYRKLGFRSHARSLVIRFRS